VAEPVTYGKSHDLSQVDFTADAKKTLDAALEDVLGPSPHVSVTRRLVSGHPAPVLIEPELYRFSAHGRQPGQLLINCRLEGSPAACGSELLTSTNVACSVAGGRCERSR
jgi:hypothetical protein